MTEMSVGPAKEAVHVDRRVHRQGRHHAAEQSVIDTAWWDRRDPEQVAASAPVKRVGRAEDVADAILFLAGNGYVTGRDPGRRW